jgi:hypothetical protein
MSMVLRVPGVPAVALSQRVYFTTKMEWPDLKGMERERESVLVGFCKLDNSSRRRRRWSWSAALQSSKQNVFASLVRKEGKIKRRRWSEFAQRWRLHAVGSIEQAEEVKREENGSE